MNAAAAALKAPPKGPSDRTLSAADKAFHRECAVAVLNGIYSSFGRELMEAGPVDFVTAIRTARRIAYQQADEMLRGEPA